MVPKRIIYCWYGGGEMSPVIKRCMKTWTRVHPAWEVVRLDESNCDMAANAYVRGAVTRGRWALVSDYFRVLELWERGGVYLDTDCECFRPLDELTDKRAFFGYMYDSLLSCGVLGFEPRHPLIGLMLEMYEQAEWIEGSQRFRVSLPDGQTFKLNSNNPMFTAAMLYLYPDVKLDGRRHSYPDFELLPRMEVETGYVLRRGYCIHKAEASWKNASLKGRLTTKVKRVAEVIPLVHFEALIRNLNSIRHTRKSMFYERYKRDGGRF